MHILTIPDIPQAKTPGTLPPGRYVMEDNNAAEFFLMNQAARPKMEPLTMWPLGDSNRTLVVGTLGFGDAVMLTPVLREKKRANPDHEIILCCWEAQRQVFLNLPYVDGFAEYPLKYECLQDYGDVRFLEGAIEHNLLARTQNMTDRFAQQLDVDGADWVTADRKPEMRLSGDEETWAWETFPAKAGKRRLALQVQAGARCRTYPFSKLGTVFGPNGASKPGMLDAMIADGWEIYLIGSPGEFRVDRAPKGMVDMTRLGLTFRQSAAFLKTCDCVLAPDSSMMHVAGALNVPCVALFGPFPYKLRTQYYDSVFALHGPGKCPMAPCFHTHHQGLPIFPPGGPCNQTGICEELAAIEPERIRAKIEQIARPCAS